MRLCCLEFVCKKERFRHLRLHRSHSGNIHLVLQKYKFGLYHLVPYRRFLGQSSNQVLLSKENRN